MHKIKGLPQHITSLCFTLAAGPLNHSTIEPKEGRRAYVIVNDPNAGNPGDCFMLFPRFFYLDPGQEASLSEKLASRVSLKDIVCSFVAKNSQWVPEEATQIAEIQVLCDECHEQIDTSYHARDLKTDAYYCGSCLNKKTGIFKLIKEKAS